MSIVFNLTDAEAYDLIYKVPTLSPDLAYILEVYETLVSQFLALPSYISTQDPNNSALTLRLATEDGSNLITENSN
jgi:hypothetical protein